MASTYSDRLKLELMEAGANSGVWGNNTNENLEVIDAAIGGYLSKSVAGGANVTLTTANRDPNVETTNESANKVIELTGTLTDNIYVFVPAVEKEYIIFNNTSGAYTVTIAPTGHSANGVAVTQGAHTIMYNKSGTSMVDLFANSLGTLSVIGNATISGVLSGNASGISAINASNVSSGTIDDARLTGNVTLNNASTISAGTLADGRLSGNVTLNNASTISAGTLASDRLPTVPTTKGGTGLTSIGSADQVLKVNSGGTALEFGEAGGGGNYVQQVYTGSTTWTKPADVQAVKVTVLGGGGNGGQGNEDQQNTGTQAKTGGTGGSGGFSVEYIPAASIPGPVSVTVGGPAGTSSFGAFLSASGGSPGGAAQGPGSPGTPGTPGNGSGGQINRQGDFKNVGYTFQYWGMAGVSVGQGQAGSPGQNYGGGASGGTGSAGTPTPPGGTGASGIVVVEEFY